MGKAERERIDASWRDFVAALSAPQPAPPPPPQRRRAEIEDERLAMVRRSMPPKPERGLDTAPAAAIDPVEIVAVLDDIVGAIGALAQRLDALEGNDTVLRWSDVRGERPAVPYPKSDPAWPGLIMSEPIITRES